jgi:hypothetical protein
MSTLVVYESMWGNTRRAAEAVAEGLGDDVPVIDVAEAPRPLPRDVDTLVVGGSTHTFSISRASTRQDAQTKGADQAHVTSGVREWLGALPASDHVRVGDVRHPYCVSPPPPGFGREGRCQGGAPAPPRQRHRNGELLRGRHGRAASGRRARPRPSMGRVAERWPIVTRSVTTAAPLAGRHGAALAIGCALLTATRGGVSRG